MSHRKLILLVVTVPLAIYGFRTYLDQLERAPILIRDENGGIHLEPGFFENQVAPLCERALDENLTSLIVMIDPVGLCPGMYDEPVAWLANMKNQPQGVFGSVLLLPEGLDTDLSQEIQLVLAPDHVVVFPRAGDIAKLAALGLCAIAYSQEYGLEWIETPKLPEYTTAQVEAKLETLVSVE